MKKTLLIISALLLMPMSFSFAGNNASFPVSCTLPAIPGINVPLLEKEDIRNVPEVSRQVNTDTKTPEIIQQDTHTSGSGDKVILKTLYER